MIYKSERGFAGIILVAVLGIIIILAGAGYLLVRRPKPQTLNPTSTPAATPIAATTPTPTADETADWKTYRNEKYGFEFKYPRNWFFSIEDILSDNSIISIDLCSHRENIDECAKTGTAPHDNVYLFRLKKNGAENNALYSFVFGKNSKVPSGFWPWGSDPAKDNCNTDSKIIDKRTAKLWDCFDHLHVFWEKDKNDQFFYNVNGYNFDVFPESRNVLNQVLSTFRFIE